MCRCKSMCCHLLSRSHNRHIVLLCFARCRSWLCGNKWKYIAFFWRRLLQGGVFVFAAAVFVFSWKTIFFYFEIVLLSSKLLAMSVIFATICLNRGGAILGYIITRYVLMSVGWKRPLKWGSRGRSAFSYLSCFSLLRIHRLLVWLNWVSWLDPSEMKQRHTPRSIGPLNTYSVFSFVILFVVSFCSPESENLCNGIRI
jgi:hypothetical protein